MGHGRAYRLTAIDMLRGLAIVVMAIDHVRDYLPVRHQRRPDGGPQRLGRAVRGPLDHALLRAGVRAAGRHQRRPDGGTKEPQRTGPVPVHARRLAHRRRNLRHRHRVEPRTRRHRASRRAGVDVDAGDLGHRREHGGASGLQWLGRNACLALGVAVVAAHNLLDPIWPASQLLDQQWPVWVALHSPMSHPAGPFLFVFRYPLLPWIGVMLLGFGVSRVFELPPARRNALLLRARRPHGGLLSPPRVGSLRRSESLAGAARGIDGNGDRLSQRHEIPAEPSVPDDDAGAGRHGVRGGRPDLRWSSGYGCFVRFGRAPFAFYVAHLYLIHLRACCWAWPRASAPDQMMTMSRFHPRGFGVGPLPVFLVWAAGGGRALSALPLGRGPEGASPRLVAQLRLRNSKKRRTFSSPPAPTSAFLTQAVARRHHPRRAHQQTCAGIQQQLARESAMAGDVAVRVGHRSRCRPGPVAQLSHSGDSAPGQRRSGPEGAGPAHTRWQAGFFRHVVRQCPVQGLLPGKGLHPGRAHGARADQSGHQTEGRPALYRVVQGANENTARQWRPGRSAYLLHAAKLPARLDTAAVHEDRADARHDGGPA